MHILCLFLWTVLKYSKFSLKYIILILRIVFMKHTTFLAVLYKEEEGVYTLSSTRILLGSRDRLERLSTPSGFGTNQDPFFLIY